MKKSLYKKFAIDKVYDFENVGLLVAPIVDKVESPLDSILNEIFSVDESGFPRGDIQYFLSKDGNPQVKAWLETNLLQPRRSVSSNPEGVTDELIAEFSRDPNESGIDYARRIAGIRDEALANIEKLKSENHGEE